MKNIRLLGILCGLLLLASAIGACTQDEELEEQQDLQIEKYLQSKPYEKKDGVYHVRVDSLRCDTTTAGTDTVVVCPPLLRKGDTIYMDYAGAVMNGALFATSNPIDARKNKITPHDPGMIIVGETKLLEGLQRGLTLMQTGETGVLIFNSSLGYGQDYVGTVPSNSILIFTLRVRRK